MAEDIVSVESLDKYIKMNHQGTVSEQMNAFRERIKSFEPADKTTETFRAACKEYGSPVIFRSPGITDKKALELLKDSDVALKAIANPSKCI